MNEKDKKLLSVIQSMHNFAKLKGKILIEKDGTPSTVESSFIAAKKALNSKEMDNLLSKAN